MRRNKGTYGIKRWTAVCLTLLLCFGLCCPGTASALGGSSDVIHICDQEDLEELAKNCRLDTWSQGKTVILEQDLVLDETAEDFLPIPTFGGILEGNGHRISGLLVTEDGAQTGLFDTIQSGGIVTGLTVVGQVTPDGDGDTIGGIAGRNYGKIVNCTFEGVVNAKTSVGGIVGVNETTGQIIQCRFQGVVTGEHYVGGIAGQNTGSLIQCENSGDINTTAVEVSTDLTDLPELSDLRTTESVPAGTDIGGIAGFSSGMIQGCKNTGNVGYEHMGYNVGGIVGRQSGYLDGCSNEGLVQGRKDVGGIAGQLEPQVILRYDEDMLQKLWDELDVLQGMMDQTLEDTGSASDRISADMDQMISDVDAAKDAASDLSDAMSDWGNENIGQINDASARLSWVIGQAEPVLDRVTRAMEHMEEAAGSFSDAADNAEEAGEDGGAAVSALRAASEALGDGVAYAKSSRTHLRTALQMAGELLSGSSDHTTEDILEELEAAKTELQNALDMPKKAIEHAHEASGHLEDMGGPGGDALGDISDASEGLEDAISQLERATDRLSDIAATLAEEPEIAFSPIDSSVTDRGDALDEALSRMLDSVENFRSGFSSSSDTLLDDIRGISNQLGVIIDILQENVEKDEDEELSDKFEDVSDEEEGEEASGRITGAVNTGEVRGDLNVAGIVGSMSIEYDFDPEDDLTEEGTRSLDFRYKTLAVVTDCVNKGSITAKKDYVGGIVGRMDLGAVKACGSYGEISSSDGDYAGGISGLSRATIRDCFVKCSLSGGDYIGGVMGSGEEDSVMTGCYTMVEITECGRYYGAVSGTETGAFSENYFVSEDLAGLGRISYTGKAEPITFAQLTQIEGLPEEMTQFTLQFVVEDQVIKTETFTYGDSFGEDDFPEIPAKDGYYAVWDREDLTNLSFDTTVTAEYCRYVLALASEVTRESGRPVFLADGDYDEDASLMVSQIKQPETVGGRTAIEQWYLEFSDQTQDTYTVRYLSPEESPDGLTVFVKEDGQWQEAECSVFGSYLVFSMASPQAEVAVVTSAGTWLMRLVLAIVVLAILAVLAVLIRKRRQKPRKEKQPDCEKQERKPLPAPIQALIRWKKRVLLILAAVLLLAAGLWIVSRVRITSGVYELLQSAAESEDCAFTLTVDAKMEETMEHMEIHMRKTQAESRDVVCIQSDGIPLYYADGMVIMENGKAYEMSERYPDYSTLALAAEEVFRSTSFSTEQTGEDTLYQLTAEGENARTLLKYLLPAYAEDLTDTHKLTLEVAAHRGELVSANFASEGTLADEEKTAYRLEAEWKPETVTEEMQIPAAVLETIRTGTTEIDTEISEELFRLFSAWTKLDQEEAFSAELLLEAEWKDISLSGTWTYEQTEEEGQTIRCIRKDENALYYANGIFCDGNGAVYSGEEDTMAARSGLLEVFYQICLNGDFECMDTGNEAWLYTLSLESEDIQAVVHSAAPELEGAAEWMDSGSMQILVKDGIIAQIRCECAAGAEGGAVLSAELTFSEKSGFEIPAAVKERLVQEREDVM